MHLATALVIISDSSSEKSSYRLSNGTQSTPLTQYTVYFTSRNEDNNRVPLRVGEREKVPSVAQ